MSYKIPLVLSMCTLMLVGCSADSDLDEWMGAQKAEQKNRGAVFLRKYSVAPPAQFDPYPFHPEGLISPFDPTRILMELPKGPEGDDVDQALVQEWLEEENRIKQPLEDIPLESMAMVGFMIKDGNTVALVKVDDFVHSVKAGDYLGLDKGKVQHISETSIDLRELIKTGQGNVMERFQTLRLQEGQL